MKADRIVLGIVVVVAGAALFLVNIGVLSEAIFRELWRYSPLALILWGFLLLFGKGDGGGCLGAIIMFAVIIGILTMFFPAAHHFSGSASELWFEAQDEDVALIRLDLRHSAGELSIKSLEDLRQTEHVADSMLVHARILGSAKPETRYSMRDEKAISEISIRDAHMSWYPGNQLRRWEVWLADDVPSEVVLETGAIRADIDLYKLNVQDLRIKAGAGDLVIYLGTNNADITVESGAGNIVFYVHEETGVRLNSNAALLSFSGEDAGVFKIGEYRYESEDLSEKEAIAEIAVKAGVGAVSVREIKSKISH